MPAFSHRSAFARFRFLWIALSLGVIVVVCDLSAPADAVVDPRPQAVALARPLSAADAGRYHDIFALQADGDWQRADRLIGALGNELLLGHVLAQRYLHPTAYRSRYRELADWLARYADHPDADRLYRLALARKPAGATPPRRPAPRDDSLAAEEPLDIVHPYWSNKKLTLSQRRQVQRLKRKIRSYIRRFYLTRTERLLEQDRVHRLFDRYELDSAYAEVAAGWLYIGKAENAFRLADDVAGRSGDRIPTAHWTAGLAAWRLDRPAIAAGHFERLAAAKTASAWNRSAGAYWAGRAHQRLSDPAAAQRWLERAAQSPTTFYSLLAKRRLGRALDVTFEAPLLTAAAIDRLMAAPGGARALALVQVGARGLAERELMALAAWRDPQMVRTILALTAPAELPRLGWEIAQRLLSGNATGWSEQELGATLYPLPPWQPQGGFRVDRALVFAFMRQESSFDPGAKSPEGARGLMQLMPATARSLDRKHDFKGPERDLLFDPALNLALGQRYLTQLLNSQRVDRDVLRLAVAYNAGPGNLGRWERQMSYDGDPLLFIESLPTLETRLFAERVLTNLWIYRVRLGQPTPSLDALAADRWPAYEALDGASQQVAATP